MHTNGTTEPFATLADVMPFAGKRPGTWSLALELCRKARGWSQKQFLVEAHFKATEVGLNDVKRWEQARAWPTMSQCQKIREAMPEMMQFDDLCRLELRADPKKKKAGPLPSLKPEFWPGPPVRHFGEALRWARIRHGISQKELANLAGVVTVSPWEREGAVMIRGTYEHLCEILPELRAAPLPPFSARFQNQMKGAGYLRSKEMQQEMTRAQRALEPVEPEAPRAPPPHRGPDTAPLNSAGANYGVLRAAVIGLEAEMEQLGRRHTAEIGEITGRLDEAKGKVTEAEEHMKQQAMALHRRPL